MSYFKKQQNGLLLQIYVQPGAKTEGFSGLHGGRVKIRIKAPATDNLANKQVVAFLAAFFGISKSKVELVRGEKSRNKDVLLQLEENVFTQKLII